MEMITLTIDGQRVEVKKGTTVLEAARASDIYIPTLCFDPDLKPYGACRLCVVEIENMRGLPTACTTTATEGMVVHTETPKVNKTRCATAELLINSHPVDCLVCHQRGQCELQDIAAYLGIESDRLERLRRVSPPDFVDTSNPFFIRDASKCILCGKCVRACDEIAGFGVIDLAFRGIKTIVSTFGNMPLLEADCKSCGECLVRCPTGALTLKQAIVATRQVQTICPYCGVGCSISLGLRPGKIVSVTGVRENSVNKGKLCAKGRFGIPEFVHHPERLTSPLIRRNGKLEEATWEEALDITVSKFSHYQGDKVAVISSAKCTNEDNYITQKFARAVLGTNNVDHCARL